jgi:hypothetical protein
VVVPSPVPLWLELLEDFALRMIADDLAVDEPTKIQPLRAEWSLGRHVERLLDLRRRSKDAFMESRRWDLLNGWQDASRVNDRERK